MNEEDKGLFMNVYPNPFSNSTTINFLLTSDTHVKITVYDMNGRFVKEVYNADVKSGDTNTAEWYAEGIADGIYIYRMVTDTDVFTGKLILVKN